jgi:hypothetical protein
MSYEFESLDRIVRNWIDSSAKDAGLTVEEYSQHEIDYGDWLDEQEKDPDEQAYIKYMEQEEAKYMRSLR